MTRTERGSAAVEALLVAPALLALIALLVGGGRITSDQAAIRGVAREAGRIAVTASTPAEAIAWGKARARDVAAGYGLEPSRLGVTVSPGSLERGDDVRVHVTYVVPLSDLPSLGLIPGAANLSASHVEPIDIHRSR